MYFIYLIFAVVSVFFIVQLVYPFVTTLLAQLFGKERLAGSKQVPENVSTDYACIITAYKNAAIAGPLVTSLLRQTHANHLVYLVADECPPVDFKIDDPRFILLQPDPPLRLKAKSIQYAMDRFQRAHDYTAVFDADNLAHPQLLEVLNQYVAAGYQCIQGQRTAKNLDTTYAALDSTGEHYKNYLERYVPYLLGGSAVISGSGMATETALYQAYLHSPAIAQGQTQGKKMLQEDKILQNFLLRRDVKIAYAREAIVYDEKVESGDAVETQRSRWLFSYFQNLPNAAGLLLRGLTRLGFNQLYFGFVTLVLPMFIQVGIAGLLAVMGLFFAPLWSLALAIALGIFALNILWTLHLDHAPPPIWAALWQVPKFVLRQFTGLFKMRNPNKHFKHTEHKRYVSVDEVIGQSTAPEER